MPSDSTSKVNFFLDYYKDHLPISSMIYSEKLMRMPSSGGAMAKLTASIAAVLFLLLLGCFATVSTSLPGKSKKALSVIGDNPGRQEPADPQARVLRRGLRRGQSPPPPMLNGARQYIFRHPPSASAPPSVNLAPPPSILY